MNRKIAFVIHRYGTEVMGGAEIHCRWICERLAKHFRVEVLTTCAADADRWENYYPPGNETINGVLVRRFPLSARDRKKFEWLDQKRQIYGKGLSETEGIDWLKNMGPHSDELLNYLSTQNKDYACFIFFTYLFSTTVFGVPLVKDKALLVPTVHDEPYIYLSLYDNLFYNLQGIFFNCLEEQDFVFRRFPKITARNVVVGTGINYPNNSNNQTCFKQSYGLEAPYIIYVGKVSPGKGCDQLIQHFINYKKVCNNNIQLVLLGGQQMTVPYHPDVRALGFVSEEDKFSAIASSEFLINHSQNESLSLALLEAWAMGKPVLVNGRCDVLVGQCKRSNGGLWYWNYPEFKECLNWIIENRELAQKLAQSGKRYLESTYNWATIEEKYFSLIQKFL